MHNPFLFYIVIDTQKSSLALLYPSDKISLLALPEHHVRLPRDARRINDDAGWGLFSILEFDIICYNDVCKEGLDFADHEEPTRADRGI